ncbi:MAG: carboxypeptidase regulatory-like domain-containing protein, partial [Gemmatimonadales bacterium]
MIRPVVRMIVGIGLALATAAPLAAQAGTIRGSVADSGGAAISHASLIVEGTGLRTTSGSEGRSEIRGVPAGTHTVRVRAIGYQAAAVEVTVAPGDVVDQDFALGRSSVQLAPIDVVVGSRARHTAEEELAVPVDIFPAEELQQQ